MSETLFVFMRLLFINFSNSSSMVLDKSGKIPKDYLLAKFWQLMAVTLSRGGS